MSAACPSILSLLEQPQQSTWLQLVSHLNPAFGGIASLLPMFCRSAESEGVRSPVFGFCDSEEYADHGNAPALDVTCVSAGRVAWAFDPGTRAHLKKMMRNSNGIHIHGLWETHCAIGAALAQACGCPYIVSAHGMLERWALQTKRLKKALYATLVETGNLRRASCLRALTESEVNDYRRIGLTNPVAVVPSGVTVPDGVTDDAFLNAHPELRHKRLILFLGRLHRKKGLTILLKAWRQIGTADAHVVIAGPDYDGTRAALEQLTLELAIRDRVTFTGMLSGSMKWSALAAASVFVLPSYSEGFSVAVLEAIAMGLPVIVSRACNIPEAGEYGCGWVVDAEEQSLKSALKEAADAPEARLRAIGERGRMLVSDRFSWRITGRQMAEVYRWVLGGPLPTNVPIYKGTN